MAPRNTERNERELNSDINAAIAGTEDEIFREAMEAALDDNDGDNSLEEMGDGLEGEPLDEDDTNVEDTEGPIDDEEDDEDGEDEEDEDGDEGGEADGDDEEGGEDEGEEPTRDNRGRQQPNIPPGRLREATERARRVEQERDQARNQITTLEARFNDLLQRVNSGQVGPAADKRAPAAEKAAKPDMFTDPEGYETWVLEQAEERAAARVNSALADRDRRTQEEVNQRVDRSFNEAATGERGFEFMPAYNALKSLDPKDPQAQKLVRGIFSSADPQEALFAWWDNNGGQDFRENIAKQLGFEAPRRQRRDDGGNRQQRQQRDERGGQQQQRQVRHEIRPAQRLRSLNGASGGGGTHNRNSDPEMLDNSEDSVFRFATKR